ncbi:MAG: hypothetical protein QM706_11825 [Nitrospira sp.]
MPFRSICRSNYPGGTPAECHVAQATIGEKVEADLTIQGKRGNM